MSSKKTESAVPSSRLARLAKFGRLTGGIAGSILLNGAKQLASGERPNLSDLLLTPSNAKRMVAQLSQMRGAAMKLGQILSMDAGDLIPPELAKILAALRADATSMPRAQVEQVLIKSWGKDWAKRVKSFEFEPLASASIGQVHRAIGRKGELLAIKLQYPGVRKSIDSDVDNVASLLRFSGLIPSQMDLKPFLKDAKKQLHQEADYLREGAFLQRFKNALVGDASFLVPEWYEALSAADLLTMGYVESVPIESLVAAPQATRNKVIEKLFELFLRELFEFRMVQTDPNFANYRYAPQSEQIVLLDFGAVHEYSIAMTAQFKKLMKAALKNDQERMRAAAQALGYFDEATSSTHQAMLMEMFGIAFEAQCFEGEYDFAKSDLAARLNPMGFELMKDRTFWKVPPTPVLLLQRKAAGIFLLAVRLGAKVNINALVKAVV
jgi:predicted unusual protein kinase regulating ubiquinone biosynthesis (AarF/ABC1/UbiB family)